MVKEALSKVAGLLEEPPLDSYSMHMHSTKKKEKQVNSCLMKDKCILAISL
jgi:hypothetical protein